MNFLGAFLVLFCVERLKWRYLLPFFFQYKYIHGPSIYDVKRKVAGTVTNIFFLGLTLESLLSFFVSQKVKVTVPATFLFEYKVDQEFFYLWREKKGSRYRHFNLFFLD
jgi:hypothetical protein